MSWLQKLMPARIRTEGGNKRNVPEGLWEKCEKCGTVLYGPELERNLEVCPKCGHHRPIGARARLASFLDPDSMTEIAADLAPTDPLKFRDSKKYVDRLKATQKATGEKDAMVVMRGNLKGLGVVAAAFEFRFMGGSMGSVVGEKFARAAELALADKMPLRKTVTKKHAADVLYLLLGPDLYWTMVLGRGWTERQLANWTERVVLNDLFGLEPAQDR